MERTSCPIIDNPELPHDESPSRNMIQNVHTGEYLPLISLWRERRILLVFLRHFGCRLCKSHIAEIKSIKHRLDKYHIDVVFVGLGTLESAKEYLALFGNPPGEFYVATDAVKGDINGAAGAYAMMKLIRGLDHVLSGEFERMAQKAFNDGYTDTPYVGSKTVEYPDDSAQLGGVFILGPGNSCEYSYRSAYGGDTPDLQEVLNYAKESKRDYGRKYMSLSKDDINLIGDDDSTSESSSNNSGSDVEEPAAESRTRARSKVPFVNPKTQEWVSKLQMDTKIAPPVVASPSKTSNDTSAATMTVPEVGSASWNSPVIVVIGLATLLLTSRWLSNSILGGIIAGIVTFTILLQSKKFINAEGAPVSGTSTVAKQVTDISKTLLNQIASVPRPLDKMTEVRLYTPVEIDTLVMESGEIECDCPSVVMDLPLTGKVEVTLNDGTTTVGPASESRYRSGTMKKDGLEGGLSKTELNASAQMLCFLREFLAKPHPLLGRKGPVCPFIPTALRKNTVWLAIIRTGPNVTAGDIVKVVQPMAERFGTLEPREGIMSSYKAVCMVFPDIQIEDARRLIDGVQELLKPQFVAKSLMIGEFHKQNNASGLKNPDFYPLRTPVPVLAIRHMVTGDIAFLDMSKYAADIRVSFLSSYLSRFESDDAPRTLEMLNRAREELKKAQEELQGK